MTPRVAARAAAALAVLSVAIATPGQAAVGLTATITAAGHTPRIGAPWHYAIHAELDGHPVAGSLTATIVDPVGGVHPLGRGARAGNVTHLAFSGVYRDFVVFPASSRGIPLKLRFVVNAHGATSTVVYAVTPRA
jgi:hypothetical protein